MQQMKQERANELIKDVTMWANACSKKKLASMK